MAYGGRLARAMSDELNARRVAAGYSVRGLAKLLGVTHPYLGKRFAQQADFALDDLERAAKIFELTPQELITAALDRLPDYGDTIATTPAQHVDVQVNGNSNALNLNINQ